MWLRDNQFRSSQQSHDSGQPFIATLHPHCRVCVTHSVWRLTAMQIKWNYQTGFYIGNMDNISYIICEFGSRNVCIITKQWYLNICIGNMIFRFDGGSQTTCNNHNTVDIAKGTTLTRDHLTYNTTRTICQICWFYIIINLPMTITRCLST